MSYEKVSLFLKLRKENPKLFELYIKFINFPALYIHPSWQKKICNGLIPKQIWESKKFLCEVSELISQELLDKKFEDEIYIKSDQYYILLPTESLARVAKYLGAIIVGHQIRASLAREDVLFWKNILDSELYDFAVSKAMLLANSAVKIPEKKLNELEDIEGIGYGLLAQSLCDANESVKKRAYLKFRYEFIPSKVDVRISKNLVQTVITILEPQWHSLFEQMKN